MHFSRLPFIFIFLGIVACNAISQESQTNLGCVGDIMSPSDQTKFVKFDRELKDALRLHDAGKVALLVRFPIRIDDDYGTYYLHDARSLQGHYDAIFRPRLLRLILKPINQMSCVSTGILYGNGQLLVNSNESAFYITHINAGSPNEPKLLPGSTRMSCKTTQYRAIVDIGSNGKPRYREWKAEQSTTENPNSVIYGGTENVEGTGGCSHREWKFKDRRTIVKVAELGCFPDSNQPPKDATGQLSITTNDGKDNWWWCY
jgi:hypothetical protein